MTQETKFKYSILKAFLNSILKFKWVEIMSWPGKFWKKLVKPQEKPKIET